MSFTIFDSYAPILEAIPDRDMRAKFCLAVVEYGLLGAEPELEWPLKALFESVRGDIENSAKNKGGRPRKGRRVEGADGGAAPCENRVSETAETHGNPLSENSGETENPLSEDTETPGNPLSENPETSGNPPYIGKARLGKARLEEGEGAPPRRRFRPPTMEEVQARIDEMRYGVSASRFVAYYESNGWRVGKNPMKDWKAALAGWESRDKEGPDGRCSEELVEASCWL